MTAIRNHLFKIPQAATALLGAGAALLLWTAPASADDQNPGVARISFIAGEVDVRRSDANETVAASINAPVMVGDYVSTGDNSRSEVQYDYGNMLRLGPDTQIRLSQLDSSQHITQIAQGTADLAVLHQTSANQELQTPSVTVRPDEPGLYRVTVTIDGNTEVTVRAGRADILTPQGTRTIASGGTLIAEGSSDNPNIETIAPVAYDDFDSWNSARDRNILASQSYRYVNDNIVGASDLDAYGRWSYQPSYGEVWVPSDVSPGWSPYTDGRWVWEPYYGWTWVDSEPWGWAPYHYGRWFYAGGGTGWCWYPGPVAVAQAWAPAYVGFFGFGGGGGGGYYGGGGANWGVSIGGPGFNISFGNVGWVPLAPYEAYNPWWGAGNTYINKTVVINNNITNNNITNNYYNSNVSINRIYRNAAAPGGVVALSSQQFQNGQYKQVQVVRDPGSMSHVVVTRGVVPVVPTQQSLRFSDRSPQTQLAALKATQTQPASFNRFATAPKPVAGTFEQQRAAVTQTAQAQFHAAPIGAVPSALRAQTNVVPQQRTLEQPGAVNQPKTGPPGGATIQHPNEPAGVTNPNAPAGATNPNASPKGTVPKSPWERFGGSSAGVQPSGATHTQTAPSGTQHTPSYAAPQHPTPANTVPGNPVPANTAPQQHTPVNNPAPQAQNGSPWNRFGGSSTGVQPSSATHTQTAPSGTQHVPSYAAPQPQAPVNAAPQHQTPVNPAPQHGTPVYTAPKYHPPAVPAPAPQYHPTAAPAPLYHPPASPQHHPQAAPVYHAPPRAPQQHAPPPQTQHQTGGGSHTAAPKGT